MSRAQTPETTFSHEGTVRVLAKVPYVNENDAPQGAPSHPYRVARLGFLAYLLSDPVRRGLALGTAATLLLGTIWFFATRSRKEVAQNPNSKPWEVAVPRPDAPEAPAWNPTGSTGSESVQSTQAQPVATPASYGPTKSPLGFDLPPGNGWGAPEGTVATFGSGETNLVTSPGGSPFLNWERPAPGGPMDGSVMASASSSQQVPSESAPMGQPLPWANAAGYPSQAAVSPVPGPSPAGYFPGQAGTQADASGVVRNPYYDASGPHSTSVVQGAGSGNWSGVPGGTPGVPAGWPAPVSLQPPANPQPSLSLASRPATGPVVGSFPTVGTGVSGGSVSAAPTAATGWGTPLNGDGRLATYTAPSYASPQAPWAGAVQAPQAVQPQASSPAGSSQQAAFGSATAWRGVDSAYPATQAAPSAGQLPNAAPVPVYPSTSPGPWSLPTAGSESTGPRAGGQEVPYYPSTDSFRSSPQSTQPLNAPPADPQVVPATYANPNSRSGGVGTSSPPAANWDFRRGATTWPSAPPASQPYPTTGQAGYNLYPSSTLR